MIACCKYLFFKGKICHSEFFCLCIVYLLFYLMVSCFYLLKIINLSIYLVLIIKHLWCFHYSSTPFIFKSCIQQVSQFFPVSKTPWQKRIFKVVKMSTIDELTIILLVSYALYLLLYTGTVHKNNQILINLF